MTSRRDAYRLLGIPLDASRAEVRAAFRKKAIQAHPDTGGNTADGSAVRDLIDAYQILNSSLMERDEPNSAGRAVPVNQARGEVWAGPSRRQCRECENSGLRMNIATCPACRGSPLLTTLDVDRVKVFRCLFCRGRGRVPVIEQCAECEDSRY